MIRGGTVALVLLLAMTAGQAEAAREDETSLEQALDLHEAAADFEGETRALEALEGVVAARPESWQAAFWTAYVHSQVARLVGMGQGEGDADAHLDRSQELLDRARELAADVGSAERAGMRALQSLLHLFQDRGADDPKKRSRATLEEAIATDPTSPVVQVMVGTELIGEGQAQGRKAEILAGHALLERAAERFEADTRPRHETVHFNSEWLPFWLPRAEKLLHAE